MALDKEHKYVNEITQQEHDDTANIELKKVGSFGWNTDSLEWKRLQVDANGKLNVNATATIDTAGLATYNAQTDGSQTVKLVDGSNTALQTSGGILNVLANIGDANSDNIASIESQQTDGSQKTQVVLTTSGGYTTFHLVSAASDNATVVKDSAGQLYGWYIYNSNASARKLAFHDTASAPTAGSEVLFSIVIPPTSGANVFNGAGIQFGSGIAITTVTELADNGTTGVASGDLIINLFYF